MTFKSLLLTSLLLSPLAYAQSDITVHDAHVRTTPPNAPTSAIFVTLTNTGSTERQLTAITTPVAGKAELHEVLHDGDMMQMRQVDKVTIPAQGSVALTPGGLHIMLFDLKQPLVEGENVEVDATFANGETVHFQAPVMKISSEMSMHSMDHHEHMMPNGEQSMSHAH